MPNIGIGFVVGNMGKFWDLFKAGSAVKDAIGLKSKQKIANAITFFLISAAAIGKAMGYDFGLSAEDWLHIGGAIAAVLSVFNVGATVASSDKVGLLSNKQPDNGGQDSPSVEAVSGVAEAQPPSDVQPQPRANSGTSIWDNPDRPGG